MLTDRGAPFSNLGTLRNLPRAGQPGKMWPVVAIVGLMRVAGALDFYRIPTQRGSSVYIQVAGEPLRLVPDAERCLIVRTRLPRPGHPFFQKPRHCVTRTSFSQNLNGAENAKVSGKNRPDTCSDGTGTPPFLGNALHNGQQIAAILEESVHNLGVTQAQGAYQVIVSGKAAPLPILNVEAPAKRNGFPGGIVALTTCSSLRAALSRADAKSVDLCKFEMPEDISADAVGAAGLNPENLRISPPSDRCADRQSTDRPSRKGYRSLGCPRISAATCFLVPQNTKGNPHAA